MKLEELKEFVDELWEDMLQESDFKESMEINSQFQKQLDVFKAKLADLKEKELFRETLKNVQGIVEKSTKLLMETMIKGDDPDSQNIMEYLSPVEIEFVCNEISEKIIRYRMDKVEKYLFDSDIPEKPYI
jgi:hypothetical protein